VAVAALVVLYQLMPAAVVYPCACVCVHVYLYLYGVLAPSAAFD
jgi:hypothetical protein